MGVSKRRDEMTGITAQKEISRVEKTGVPMVIIVGRLIN